MSSPATVRWWACARYVRTSYWDPTVVLWHRDEVILMPNMYQPPGSLQTWFAVPLPFAAIYDDITDRFDLAKRMTPVWRKEHLNLEPEEV